MWQKEHTAALVVLWCNKRLSMTQIGRILDISRSAVAGRIYRLGLSGGTKKKRKELHARKCADNYRRKCIKRKKWWTKEVIKRVSPKPITQPILTSASKGVTLLERNQYECAYIIGYHICCGETVCIKRDKLTSYCTYHWDSCHQARAA